MMRFFDQTLPRMSAMGISTALRMAERPGQRKRFFAVCMVMVEAPRVGPASPAPAKTLRRAPQSTPSFWQKVASSDVATAATAAGATSPSRTVSRS